MKNTTGGNIESKKSESLASNLEKRIDGKEEASRSRPAYFRRGLDVEMGTRYLLCFRERKTRGKVGEREREREISETKHLERAVGRRNRKKKEEKKMFVLNP